MPNRISQLLVAVALCSGCTNALTDDAIVWVSPDDYEASVEALAHLQPHIGVTVAVTTDARDYATWDTIEKWKVMRVKSEQVEIDGARLCDFGPNNDQTGTYAVTQYEHRVIWVGGCVRRFPERTQALTIAHELGHMVGASDCDDGVMTWENPDTMEPSAYTVRELKGMY